MFAIYIIDDYKLRNCIQKFMELKEIASHQPYHIYSGDGSILTMYYQIISSAGPDDTRNAHTLCIVSAEQQGVESQVNSLKNN